MILCPVISIRDIDVIKLFGSSIRQKRIRKGFSQAVLSLRCQIDVRQLRRIERGETNATLSTIVMLARALEMDVAQLFDFPLPPPLQAAYPAN